MKALIQVSWMAPLRRAGIRLHHIRMMQVDFSCKFVECLENHKSAFHQT
ncbi:hypothetical protein G647_05388 [Cladophialophora carrionii CBS 160.54]|uniref:Uncharacterized protein n=1 Tax=Cladophialophora carrionii CBS 160.54 TaxID=1279043 RepID=V9DA76_9EURO|nr:uncharacterized protein G647_05388 [Cladophialophora carrionii CBS 160.54]ETI23586.1 hypothetical protein G647_05388 [Cladophialophora carrionii CBS 160.54]